MSDRLAILIGNGRFDSDPSLPELPGPRNDVASLGGLLSDPEFGNFVVFESLDRDCAHLQPELEDAFAMGHAGATLVVYYAGYVLADPGRGLFLAAADTKLAHLKQTAIPISSIKSLLRSSRSRSIVVILDCCYVGPSGRVDEIEIEQQLRRIRTDVGPDVHVIASPASCQTPEARDITAEAGAEGRLTHTMVEGLVTGAADRDGDNRIGPRDVNEYLGIRLEDRRPLWSGPLEGADPEIVANPHPIEGVDLQAFRDNGALGGAGRRLLIGAGAAVLAIGAVLVGVWFSGGDGGPPTTRLEGNLIGSALPESAGMVDDLDHLRSVVNRTGWVEHIEPLDGSGPRYPGAVTVSVDPGARPAAGHMSLGLLQGANMSFGAGVYAFAVACEAGENRAAVDVELGDGRRFRFAVSTNPEGSNFFGFVSRVPIRRARISSTSVRFVAEQVYVYAAEEFAGAFGLRY